MPIIPDKVTALTDVSGTTTTGYAPIWNGTGFDVGGTQKLADAQLSSNVPLKNAANTLTQLLTLNNGFNVAGGTAAMGAATCSTLAASSNATVGGTLGVTGAATFSSTGSFGGNISMPADTGVLTAGAFIVKDATGNLMRLLRAGAWSDSQSSSFFQLAAGYGLFTGNFGSALTRFAISSAAVQIGGGGYSTFPTPASQFEVLSSGNAVVASITNTGAATFSSTIKPGSINTATTAGTVAGQITYDASAGANTGHYYGWNGSSWLKLDN